MIFDQRIQVWLSPVMSARSSASGLGSIAEPTIADAPHPAVPVPPRKPKLRKKAKKLMPEAFKKCPRFAKALLIVGRSMVRVALLRLRLLMVCLGAQRVSTCVCSAKSQS